MIEAAGSFVVLKQEEPRRTTPSGIHLPDTAKVYEPIGVVVSVGGDVNVLSGIATGDRVFYWAGAARYLQLESGIYVAVMANAIIARLKPEIPSALPIDVQ